MAAEIQIEVDEIQGDVLVGLQKEQQAFLSFEIVDVAAFKRFLLLLAPRITSLRVTIEREFILAERKGQGRTDILTLVGTVIGFTADGLRRLSVPDVDGIGDQAFRDGLSARSGLLDDPAGGDGTPERWLVGAPGQALHGLLMVTGPSVPPQSSQVDHVRKQVDLVRTLAGASWRVLREDFGTVRLDARGHEHFGFQDGVSQPGVRGQIDAAFPGRTFLTPRLNPDDGGQGLPGQDLVWPGAFVFGYPGQPARGGDEEPGPVVAGGPAWVRNGSLMVYRRLRQLVPEFEADVRATAAALDMDAELLAARMVGRWKSGAPLVTTPLGDDPGLAADPSANNDFEFSLDRDGRRRPFAAHIHKSYPRDDVTPAADPIASEAAQRAASAADTETHRMIRAGIPYGDPVSLDEQGTGRSAADRGLMFVCYQTSKATSSSSSCATGSTTPASPSARPPATTRSSARPAATGPGGSRAPSPRSPRDPAARIRRSSATSSCRPEAATSSCPR